MAFNRGIDMNAIFSYVNKVIQPWSTTTTFMVYENRVEVLYTSDMNGTVVTSQYIWSIKNIKRVDLINSPQEVKLVIDNSPALKAPKTADAVANLEKFVQIVKEML